MAPQICKIETALEKGCLVSSIVYLTPLAIRHTVLTQKKYYA